MSTDEEAADTTCCASCGKVDEIIKLKKCTACKLVRYCCVNCQKEHRPKHKKACKKRAAELRDEILFQQPESTDLGDCPICVLPLPLDTKYSIMSCCSKRICMGCSIANTMREYEESLQYKCPFCRQPVPKSAAESFANQMKRVEANDPAAFFEMGTEFQKKGDYATALKHWTKAVELGDVGAHYQLSVMYNHGVGVDRDTKKELYHLEQAAIGGHPEARFILAIHEGNNFNIERAVKHHIIAAKLGHDGSMKQLKELYASGMEFIRKVDFEAALRGHQAAVDATKSPQREFGVAARSKFG
jgi:hypothetical protein